MANLQYSQAGGPLLPLWGSVTDGEITLSIVPTAGIKQVVWYFDEKHWWIGGPTYGPVRFSIGSHQIQARVTPTRGSRYTLVAHFDVPNPEPPPPPTVKPETFGAKGDGVTDDSAAIQKALDSLRAGETLEFAAGKTYAHSTVLRATVPDTVLLGHGTLLALNEAQSSLQIMAANITVSLLTLRVAATTKRWDTPSQMRLYLGKEATGARVISVEVIGSAAAGIFVAGTSDFALSHVAVQNTRADGIHITGGANKGQITSPVVRSPGDDGVAIVSYKIGALPCHDIVITSPSVLDQKWGRAFSVVGGHDITWRDVLSNGSGCAAIYIAAESEWNTYGCQRITVDGGTLTNSNTNITVDHGAVLIYNSQATEQNTDIIIRNLTVKDTRLTTSRQLGLVQYNGGTSTRVTMENIAIVGGCKWLYSGNAPASATRRTGWTWDGKPVPDAIGWQA